MVVFGWVEIVEKGVVVDDGGCWEGGMVNGLVIYMLLFGAFEVLIRRVCCYCRSLTEHVLSCC